MVRRVLTLPLVVLLVVSLLGVVSVTPTHAYGAANWQIGLSSTGVAPGTGFGLGFWGWCEFGGGVISGNTGDCQFAQYIHTGAGSGFTCHISLDITSWTGSGGTFVITGTASVNPTAQTAPCLGFFPGSASFSGVDTGIPAAPGHYTISNFFGPGLVGSFHIQVTQIG